METIGLRELKTHLSEYVGRSRDGERIVISDRGREIAELTPLSTSRKAMIALREAGKVTWSGSKPKGLRGLGVSGKAVAETIAEDRR